MARAKLTRRFAKVVRQHRVALDLSQEKLAETAGLHRNFIGMIERGERTPTIEAAGKIARALGESLIALDAIVRRMPPILERIFPGTTIGSVELYVSKVQEGSLAEDFLVKFVFGSQKEFDTFLKRTRKKLGMEKLADRSKLVA